MGAALHGRTVHERAGVALVAVADDVLGPFVVACSAAPFATGGEARTALAAQAARLDLVDDLLGGHLQGLLQALVAAAGDVVVDAQRVDDAHIAQHHLVLQGVERVVVHVLEDLPVLPEHEPFDRLPVKRSDDRLGVLRLHPVVHEVARHEAHDGTLLAFARAAGSHDVHGDLIAQATCIELGFDGGCHVERAVGDAARAAADQDLLGSVNHGWPPHLPERSCPECRESGLRAACCDRCRPPP